MKKLFALCILLFTFHNVEAQYCIPTYPSGCNPNLYISDVTTGGAIQNISNLGTGCNNYTYYTGTKKVVEVNAGSTFTVQVVYPKAGQNLARTAVYIDYDQNQIFDNNPYNPITMPKGEFVVNLVGTTATPITVNPFAKDGVTRLRFRIFYKTTDPTALPLFGYYPTGTFDACQTWSGAAYGETEDYDIIIHNPCKKIPSVNITNVTSKGADISWTVNGNERWVEYMIDQSPNDPGNGNFLLNNTQTSIHVPDTNTTRINCNTKYYFHIRDVCDTESHSQATWSYGPWRLDSFQTPPCCDVPPITVDNITSNTAIASWGPVTSVIQYEYAVSISDSPEPTGGTRYNGTTTLLPGLDCSREYYFFLRALCSPTPTSDWGIDSFLTQPCTSIDNSPVLPEFKLNAYPNPTRNVVTLSVMHGIKREVGAIEVMDVTGKVLKTAVMDGDKLDLNLNDVPSGLYMIRYSDEQRTQVIKVRRE
ncbi:MAG: T9SS type A sorting domain-containing protein [Bacteroidetes bacterium]|nr:T9SS type A sorting domain-containing protein [Bacteroidota bacterium]